MLLIIHCVLTCLSYVDELELINDCASFFVVIIKHPSIAVHNKNIYCSGIFKMQTILGGVFSLLFSICSKNYAHIHTYTHTNTYIHTPKHTHTHTHHSYVCVHLYVCMYYVYVYTHTHTHTLYIYIYIYI